MSGVRNPGLLAWLYMMRVSNKIHHASADHLEKYDLTAAQFDVLAHLNAKSGISQQALSERLLVTKGNVCGLIDRMESRGLVSRRSHPDDRRLNLLYLTDEGKALAARVVPAHEEFLKQQMEHLSAEEQRTLSGLLRDLDRSLD